VTSQPTAAGVVRRLAFPLALAALVLLTATAVALLQPHSGAGYLDPHDPGPSGSRALAQLLAHRGENVLRAASVSQAATMATRNTTLVVTSPAFLNRPALAALARLPGDRFLVEPDATALRLLAPGISPGGPAPVTARAPSCGLAAARLAGDADMGGLTLRPTAPGIELCYPGPSPAPSALARYERAGRTVTVLGTGTPLTNAHLAARGNAALALNLLASRPLIVWLTPLATAVGGKKSLASLIPWPAYLVALQLTVSVIVVAAWRARRLGPLVAEPLPVVVRAAETVEGHGRLYRSRRARDRAADALRTAAIVRLLPRLGLARDCEPATIAAAVAARSARSARSAPSAVAARSGRDAAAVSAVLFGPVPANDAALVRLADDLDALDREMT